MPEPIIKVTDLSKSYIINHEGSERYTALRDVVTNKAKKLFSFPKNLSTTKQLNNTTQEEFWALKDLNFEIQQGDRVGIIGRNGAGKSTLLKILSRITEPTKGRIELNGRVASLLEVGTGFHPELTGRENIYLNGAILGMSRAEIKRKFDEIVDFAEVERFLDTPVKRYSSGMYVRLAFAVAAHLEPEILIVDEVLAVGDAQFQKKCLGKMEDVSKNEGRTVLFVSHNMNVINSLCNKGLFLANGELKYSGELQPVISKYLESTNSGFEGESYKVQFELKDKDNSILSAELKNENGELLSGLLNVQERIYLYVKYQNRVKITKWHLAFWIKNSYGDTILFSDRTDFHEGYLEKEPGMHHFRMFLPLNMLKSGRYYLSISCGDEDSQIIDNNEDCMYFDVEEIFVFRNGDRPGSLVIPIEWEEIEVKKHE